MTYKQLFNDLKIPLAKTSKFFNVLFEAIANSFEFLQEYLISIMERNFSQSVKEQLIYLSNKLPTIMDQYKRQIIEQIIIQYKLDLKLFAEERGIIKISREDDKYYHDRIINAFTFSKKSSTLRGLRDILITVTDKKFILRELYREDWILGVDHLMNDEIILGGDVSSYVFVVDFENIFLSISERDYLMEIIDIYKPAHVDFRIKARIIDDWFLGEEGELLGISTYL